MKFTVFAFIFLQFAVLLTADAVCSEDELIRELREDIADNGNFYLFMNENS